MELIKPKIRFKKTSSSFFIELQEKVDEVLTAPLIQKADRLLKVKFFFYSLLFVSLYANLYNPFLISNLFFLTINYTFLGLSGILLAFNCSHDAVHNTFSKNRYVNAILYYFTFNLQGVNARLWKKRHITSHHIFPNVDGCDADIDDNPFIRLSELYIHKKHHRYQHIYSPLLYCLYTLHWILIKDFIYLGKKEVANMKNQTYSASFVAELVLLKLGYFSYMILLPYLLTDLTLPHILLSFFVMHVVISLFFVFTLIISHLSMETEFPTVDESGSLPFDYYEHQLAVSLDYHPTNNTANWIFGGFNSHSAHHLFPRLPHTLYPVITPIIKQTALKYNLPYHEKSIHKAILSHFRYLKKLGQNKRSV